MKPTRRRTTPTLVPPPPPPPPWDLSQVYMPPWFMPMLRDLMEAAERSFGPGSGTQKLIWVSVAMQSALRRHPTDDPDHFGPEDFRHDLIAMLIEGVWSLHFRQARPSKSVLQEALDKVKHLGARLSEAREQGFIPS